MANYKFHKTVKSTISLDFSEESELVKDAIETLYHEHNFASRFNPLHTCVEFEAETEREAHLRSNGFVMNIQTYLDCVQVKAEDSIKHFSITDIKDHFRSQNLTTELVQYISIRIQRDFGSNALTYFDDNKELCVFFSTEESLAQTWSDRENMLIQNPVNEQAQTFTKIKDIEFCGDVLVLPREIVNEYVKVADFNWTT